MKIAIIEGGRKRRGREGGGCNFCGNFHWPGMFDLFIYIYITEPENGKGAKCPIDGGGAALKESITNFIS